MALKTQAKGVAISTTHVESFDSVSTPGDTHHAVIHVSITCDCKGFQTHQHCWHAAQAMGNMGTALFKTAEAHATTTKGKNR